MEYQLIVQYLPGVAVQKVGGHRGLAFQAVGCGGIDDYHVSNYHRGCDVCISLA